MDTLLTAPGWVVLAVIGLVVFAEDALFVGFVLPGETTAILGGVAAQRGHVPLVAVVLTVVVAAVVGDSVGYEVGTRVGPRVLSSRALERRRARLDEAQVLLARRGGFAVLLGRWVAFFRAVMPAMAGSSRMPYPTFLAWNAAGGVLWGTAMVLVGYVAGTSYARIEQVVGRDAALVVLAVVVVGLVAWQVRRRRAEHRADAAEPPASADEVADRPC